MYIAREKPTERRERFVQCGARTPECTVAIQKERRLQPIPNLVELLEILGSGARAERLAHQQLTRLAHLVLEPPIAP